MTKELIYTKINETIENTRYKNSKYTKKDVMYIVLLAIFSTLLIAGIIVLAVAVATQHYRSSVSTFVCVPFTAIVITSIAFAIYRSQYNKLMKSFSLLLNANRNQNNTNELNQAINFIKQKNKNFFNTLSNNEVVNLIKI